MDVLYYYEYLFMQKFKEGVVIIEEPLKYKNDISSDGDNVSEPTDNDKQIRTPNLILLIIVIDKKQEKKIDKTLACCQLQFTCQWYKYNKPLVAKYNYFCCDETLIVYNKADYQIKYKRVSMDLWFLDSALKQHPQQLLLFLHNKLYSQIEEQLINGTVFSHYVHKNNIVEMHLDNIFQHKGMVLPQELFRCTNVKVLSLKHIFLSSLPADIGRMRNLESLILSNNLLTVKSIPQTLMFCRKLTHLYLDNNHLDALPGFLLSMPNLKSVRRHGNHNYFKSTFFWYYPEFNERVLEITEKKKPPPTLFQPLSLEMLAIQSVISSRDNFYSPGYLPETLQDFVSHVYMQFNICGYCNSAKRLTNLGFKVFTFKSPYLGNTCVPFQHWACSRHCGELIEVPARLAQQKATRKIDEVYEQYIIAIQHDQRTKACDTSRTKIPKKIQQCVLM